MSDHIQIGDISPRVQHIGDGTQTVFTYPFPIFKDADLEVYVDGVLLTLSTDYAVSGAGVSSGGEVTFVVAPAHSAPVTLVRRLAIQRTSDFQASGEFRAKVINDELDFQTASMQQIEDDLSRALRLKRNDGPAVLELPLSADRANKLIGFDANGNAKLTDLTITEIELGATGPAGPIGATGPQGTHGLFSGSEVTVTPALGDLLALKDVSDSDAPKFTSVEDVLSSIDLLPDDGANLSADNDWLIYFDASAGAVRKLNPADLGGGGGLQSIQVFTSGGTWTKPIGVSKVKVSVVGGGGGGGGTGSSIGYEHGAGGGGGGGCAIKLVDVNAVPSVSVTIGGAGSAGTNSGSNGGAGGTSSFGAFCSATGGAGGQGVTGDVSRHNEGGAGGIGANGDVNITGGKGGMGGPVGGNQMHNIGGWGGSSPYGFGGPDVFIRGSARDSGDTGSGFGGGGSGSSAYNTSVNAGSAGSGGIVIVEEYA